MAEKRYYWLKLNEDYFNNPKIKKLRKIAGGDTFTIIYLKMQLHSISNKGIITFEGIEKTFAEELALKIDEEIDDVEMTLAYLQSQGLIEVSDNDYLLPEACNNIGSQSESAERVRRFRERKSVEALHCNASVTEVKQISHSISNSQSISNSNKEEGVVGEETITFEEFKDYATSQIIEEIKNHNAEIEKANQKHKHGEYRHVLLTDAELEKLQTDYGVDATHNAIRFLDEYIEMKGTKYKSHYLALRKWVFDAVKERMAKEQKNAQKNEGEKSMWEKLDAVFNDE